MTRLPSHLKELYEKSKTNLKQADRLKLMKCLTTFQDVFSRGDDDIGHTDVVRHNIDTGGTRRVRQRPRRHPVCTQPPGQ